MGKTKSNTTKSKTLYSGKKNIDISNISTNINNITNNKNNIKINKKNSGAIQLGGGNKNKKKKSI